MDEVRLVGAGVILAEPMRAPEPGLALSIRGEHLSLAGEWANGPLEGGTRVGYLSLASVS